MTSICVVGLGYIGLPTAALLASRGYRVYGVDVRPEIVETVSAGRVHITEADLDGLVQKVVYDGLLTHPRDSTLGVFGLIQLQGVDLSGWRASPHSGELRL